MSQVNEEANKIILETVKDLLTTSTESYERIRLVFLSLHTEDKTVNDYLHKLIWFTDRHRPPLIEMKEGVEHS